MTERADRPPMQPRRIDHLNVRIPNDGVDDAVAFYRDLLGFEVRNLDAVRAGDRSLFTCYCDGECVMHLRPDDDFTPPDGSNFDHLAVVLDADEAALRRALDDAGVTIDRERDRSAREGADVALYVRDPFGYGVELRPAG